MATLVQSKADAGGRQIGLEAVESKTGRLLASDLTYEGDGIGFIAGDVLFGKLRPYLAKSWLADGPGSAVGDFHVYRPELGRTWPRYLHYVTLSRAFLDQVVASVSGAKMPRADWRTIRNVPVWAPSLHTQRAIADVLDRETGQIDALIAKQEQLITTLRERRLGAASRTHASWIGHGRRLKYAVYEVDDRAGKSAEHLPLLAVSISWGVRRRDETTTDDPRAESLASYKLARTGDIVVNRMRAFQGALGLAPVDGLVSPDYAVLRGSVSADWLASLMRSPRFVAELVQRLKGIGGTEGGAVRTPRVNVQDLVQIRVEIPPLEEQRRIVAELDAQTARIDTLIDKAERFIALSTERRAALITAAVTGELEIPADAAPSQEAAPAQNTAPSQETAPTQKTAPEARSAHETAVA